MRFSKGDYVIVKVHGSMVQPGYVSQVNDTSYDIDVCMLSLDKKHIERFPYLNVSEDMVRAS